MQEFAAPRELGVSGCSNDGVETAIGKDRVEPVNEC